MQNAFENRCNDDIKWPLYSLAKTNSSHVQFKCVLCNMHFEMSSHQFASCIKIAINSKKNANYAIAEKKWEKTLNTRPEIK